MYINRCYKYKDYILTIFNHLCILNLTNKKSFIMTAISFQLKTAAGICQFQMRASADL